MNELLTTVFKISAHVKFTNTDCDYQGICLMIKNTGLFNVKQKISLPYNFGDDLTSKIYKDEIFIFKEVNIHIVNGESVSDFHIPISDFSSDLYIKKLENIYKLCLNKEETSLFKKGSYMLRSFIIDNYMEDKNKADNFFILKKYIDAHKIYCKYNDYNDFSHYCIEMTFYCNPKYREIPYHFIDTFYYNRLIFILFKSGEYDFLCYRLYSMSSNINKDIMYELGKRFHRTPELKRKGIELMYFFGELSEDQNSEIYNGMFKKLNSEIYNGIFKKLNSSIDLPTISYPMRNFIDDIHIENFFVVDQFQVFNINYILKCKGEYTFRKITQKFDNSIDICVKFRNIGLHCKELVIKLDREYHFKLYFAVQESFKLNIYSNYKLQSQLFVSISNKDKLPIQVKSKESFSVTDKDIIQIYKEEILGITDLLDVNGTSNDLPNDPIYTDLDFKEFLYGNLSDLIINDDTVIRLDRYKKHKLELFLEDKIYKIYIKKRYKLKKKVFIFIFNSYVIKETTKLNILINNYKDEKYYLEITSSACQVIDTDFVIANKISTLYEMRCQNLKKGVVFDIKVKDKEGNYLDYDLILDLKF